MSCFLRAATAALAVILSTPALADAIDGHWCSADSRTLSIDGPAITTPGGAEITGDYSRHAFSYVIPRDEQNGGGTAEMLLVDENTIRLAVRAEPGKDAAVETWRRCDLTT